MTGHPTPEDLMGYLDDELDPQRRAAVEQHIDGCTECRREHVIFRSMKEDLTTMRFKSEVVERSVWDAVNRRLTRPVGWVLLVAGLAVWFGYAAYTFIVSPVNVFEKLTISAVLIGAGLLLASVLWERYREWRTDPYRDIQR